MPEAQKDLKKVQQEMEKRDTNDSRRKEAPLMAAPDAVQIDSSFLTIPKVVDKILDHIQKREK